MKAEARPFDATVREALKHYHEPEWLGKHSPLAMPYFLGQHLDRVAQPDTATGRGQALQRVLFQAATTLWPDILPQSRMGLDRAVETERLEIGNGGPRYLFLVLDLRYLRHFYTLRTLPTVVSVMPDYLNVSESAFYRHLEQAVKALIESLLQLVRPSLRLEQPVLTRPLVGRDEVLAICLASLQARKSVALSGVGGIGKTSVGAALVATQSDVPSFWYTFRPGLNDELHSLLFALGHFLHMAGQSLLWRQLLTTEGRLDSVAQALGFLSRDLTSQKKPFFLCFDEVDLLHTAESQPRHGVHKQVLELLEGLHRLTPVLFIGQRALIDTDVHIALQPLMIEAVTELIEQSGGRAAQLDSDRVYQATEGNPRLIELYLALADTIEEEVTLLLRRKPAVKPLFSRLWKRLSLNEKHVLGGLAVFRAYAPLDAWQDEPGFVELQRRHLLQVDARGGVAPLPFFRQLVYDELPDGQRVVYHQHAAAIRIERGQHTSVAYHLCQAGEIGTAIQLWFAVQDAEIVQGSAGAAHAVFSTISKEQVSGRQAGQLRVIQNRLNLLYGQLEAVLSDIDSYSWHPDDQLSATAFQQWGDAHRLLGDLDGARARYDDALIVLGRLTDQIITLHINRGKSWLMEASVAAAERESMLAEYEIESYKAVIAIRRGQLPQAQVHLQKALSLAQLADDARREARANYLLAVGAGNRGELDLAHEYAAAAMAYFDRVDDRLNLEGLRAELAGIYLNVGRFADVIEPAEQALQFFEQIGHGHWPGHICSNLAEAYFETGNLVKAEVFAFRAIGTENPNVQPYAYYTLGQVFHQKGDVNAAEHSFRTGLEIAAMNEDQFIAAYLHRIYGRFLIQQERLEEGKIALNTALWLFSHLTLTHEVEITRQALR